MGGAEPVASIEVRVEIADEAVVGLTSFARLPGRVQRITPHGERTKHMDMDHPEANGQQITSKTSNLSTALQPLSLQRYHTF